MFEDVSLSLLIDAQIYIRKSSIVIEIKFVFIDPRAFDCAICALFPFGTYPKRYNVFVRTFIISTSFAINHSLLSPARIKQIFQNRTKLLLIGCGCAAYGGEYGGNERKIPLIFLVPTLREWCRLIFVTSPRRNNALLIDCGCTHYRYIIALLYERSQRRARLFNHASRLSSELLNCISCVYAGKM